MKLPLHQVKRGARNDRSAFTLIEMIGVLAVIAILASMLIPRVFEAINSARVNATAVGCETIKTAVADHYGKYGQFDLRFGTTPVTFNGNFSANYDTNLMIEGLLDKPFSAKIAGGDPSTNALIELVKPASANAPAGNGGLGYALDGVNVATTNALVVEAVLYGVTAADAKDLNDRIDGTALGAPDLSTADNKGRVEYAQPTSGATTVYIYLTHR
jgi:prepilin-type N-terminal cleavage/methylation domain-containing protein